MQGKAIRINLVGKRFGRLSVIEYSHTTDYGAAMWKCHCDCGKNKIVASCHLRSGKILSCGCLGKERRLASNTTHGNRHSKLYGVWAGVKARCNNPNHKQYKDYGGRGIAVCDEWLNNFQAFHDWAMENGYSDGMTIERKDNNGNYCPGNCKWASRLEQNRNRRTTVYIEISGNRKTLMEWAKESGIPYTTLWCRYKRGRTGESLLEGSVSH